MPELVKLYRNLRDSALNHMLYKSIEGLQKEAFEEEFYGCKQYLLEDEYEVVFAFYDKDKDDYFIIRGSYYNRSSIED